MHLIAILTCPVALWDLMYVECLFGDGLKSLSFLYPNSTLTSISQIKGDIGSDLSLVFEVWIDIIGLRHSAGVFRCSLLDLEKDPCVFNINTKLLVGQAGLFPEQDADPNKLDLCLKVQATFHVLFRRAKTINFHKCFLTFDKPDGIAIDALSPEPVLSISNATTA